MRSMVCVVMASNIACFKVLDHVTWVCFRLVVITYQNNSNYYLEANVMITTTITFSQNKNDYN